MSKKAILIEVDVLAAIQDAHADWKANCSCGQRGRCSRCVKLDVWTTMLRNQVLEQATVPNIVWEDRLSPPPQSALWSPEDDG